MDEADPACHSDHNVNNHGSYTPNADTEVYAGAVCSDGISNDADGLIDSLDPGCHSDGNAGNSESYVPTDTDEANGSNNEDNEDHDTPVVPSSSHHGSTGGGYYKPGKVLGAEAACGIYVDKYLRKGYKNNTEAVIKLQKFLNDYMKAGIKEDGKFDAKTEKALNDFQIKHADKILTPWGKNKPTGIFYLTTQTEVNNIMCPDLKLPIPSDLIPFSKHTGAPKK
jgi:hypothetical protein